MNEQKNEGQWVVFNTPQGLDLNLLLSDLSIKFIPKAEFIIHQTNYYHKAGGYQMHSKNHQWFFGIKGTELALIVKRLKDAGVITLAKNYNPGNTSNTYRMVQPFDIATAKRSLYRPDEIPFIKKWVLDKYIVKNAATSAFKKPRRDIKALIASQQKEIDDLKAIISELSGGAKSIALTDLSVEYDEDSLSVPKAITPNNATTPLGEVLLADTPHRPLPDLSTAMEGLPTELSIPDTKSSVDISEEELNELESLFGGGSNAPAQGKITQLPMAGAISKDSLLNATEVTPPVVLEVSDSKELVDAPNRLDNKAINDSLTDETFLNGNLSIHPYEGMLCILYGDRVGCIENFDDIKPWCLRLPKKEKQRLYHSLITATGNIVNFPLNIHTKAKFKRKETNHGIVFTFDTMAAA